MPKDSKNKALKKKKEYPYGPGYGYRKIDVFHNGVYHHSTEWAKNTKIAKEKSKLKDGKIHAEYAK